MFSLNRSWICEQAEKQLYSIPEKLRRSQFRLVREMISLAEKLLHDIVEKTKPQPGEYQLEWTESETEEARNQLAKVQRILDRASKEQSIAAREKIAWRECVLSEVS